MNKNLDYVSVFIHRYSPRLRRIIVKYEMESIYRSYCERPCLHFSRFCHILDMCTFYFAILLKEVKYCNKIKKKHFNRDMIMTKEYIKDFKTADKCHICVKIYTEKDIKVRDHCHITGKYRCSVHQDCYFP